MLFIDKIRTLVIFIVLDLKLRHKNPLTVVSHQLCTAVTCQCRSVSVKVFVCLCVFVGLGVLGLVLIFISIFTFSLFFLAVRHFELLFHEKCHKNELRF